MTASLQTLTIGGENLLVADSGGDHPAILFVHGTMVDHTVWHKQVAAFHKTRRCVCPDLRGHGRSTASTAVISFEDHCDDLAALIDRLSLRDVTLVGWSMGGCICEVFVTRYPDKVARLVLVDTIPQRLSDDRFPYGKDPHSTPATRRALEERFEEVCDSFAARVSPEDEATARFIAKLGKRTRQDVAINDYVSTDARSQIDLLPQITLPTTIISGDLDAICDPRASSFMADRIPGCTGGVQTIAGAGHAPFLTHPGPFNRLLRQAIGQPA